MLLHDVLKTNTTNPRDQLKCDSFLNPARVLIAGDPDKMSAFMFRRMSRGIPSVCLPLYLIHPSLLFIN